MRLRLYLSAIVLLSVACLAATWGKFNNITVGSSGGNVGKYNNVTIGTTTGNIGAWNALTSPGGGTLPSLLNNKNNSAACGGGGTCATVAFSSSLTNPSTIVACGTSNSGSDTLTFTDTATNTYNDSGAGQILFITNAATIRCACAANTHTTASNVITMHSSAFAAYQVGAAEFSGVLNCTADVTGSVANGTSNASTGAVTTGSVTPTVTNDLVLGAAAGQVGSFSGAQPTWTVGASFSALDTAGMLFEYQVYNSTSAINPGGTDPTTSDPYGGITFALKHQ